MSRLNTQDDRLVRGPTGFEVQRSFLTQPQRFAVGQGTRVDQVIAGIAQVAGTISGIRENEQRKAGILEQKRFNEYYIELKRLEETYEAEPSAAHRDSYLAHRNSGFEVFGTDTDYAREIQRGSISQSRISQMEKEANDKLVSSRQGGYQRIIKNAVTAYTQDPDNISRLSSLDYTQARAEVEREVLNQFPEEVQGEFTDATLTFLQNQLISATTSGEIQSLRNDKQQATEENLKAAGFQNLISELNVAEAPEDVAGLISTYSRDHTVPLEDAVEEVLDASIDTINTSIESGTPADIRDSIKFTEKLVPFLNQEQQNSLSQAYQNAAAFEAETVQAQFVRLASADFVNLASEQTITNDLNLLGIEQYNKKFGHSVSVDTLEEVAPQNKVEKTYLDALISGRNISLNQYRQKGTKVNQQGVTLSNPNAATASEVRSLINADSLEKETLLEGYIDRLTNIITDESTPEERLAVSNIVSLMEDAKSDPAAWAKVIAEQSKGAGDDASYGRNYNIAFDEIVKPAFDGPVFTQDGLRSALAFVGPDLSEVSRLFKSDLKTVYAVSQLTRHYETNPDDDNLPAAYEQFLTDWDSVRFKGKAGDKVGVPFNELLSNQKFLKELTGEDRSQLSAAQKAQIASVIDLSYIEGGGNKPELTAKKVQSTLANAGYYTVTRKIGDSARVTIHSKPNSPEAVGLSTTKMESDLLKMDSQAGLFFSGLLNPETGPKNIPSLIRQTLLEQDEIDDRFASLVTTQALESNIKAGKIRLYLDTENSTDQGTILMAILDNQDGLSPKRITLGTIDFRNLPPQADSPDFFKSRSELNRQQYTTLNPSTPNWLFSFN